MSEFRSFAGFWIDGAVRQPEEKHWRCDKCIFAIQKHDGSLDICLSKFKLWETVYWLDTTTPTELTPQQVFDLLHVIYPNLSFIEREDCDRLSINADAISVVNWNGTTQYPPPKKWRVPTDADKNALCLCKRNSNDIPRERRFVSCFNGRFIVWNDETQASEQYDICEVLDE